MKIDVQSDKMVLSPETSADQVYINHIASELGHGLDGKNVKKAKVRIERQWNVIYIEVPISRE